MTQTTTGNVPGLLPAFYDRLLLDNLYPDLFLYQFGQKRRIPRNFGKQITFTRYYKAGSSPALPFVPTEGTQIGLSALSAAVVSATISGFASAVGVSDLIVMTAVSDVVRGAVFELSKGMALKIDNTIRRYISASGQLLPAKNQAAANSALTTTASTIDAVDLYRAAAKLRQSNARTWPDGNYAAVMHPSVAFNVRNDTSTGGWIDINKYATDMTVGNCYRGEVGRIGGMRVVESSEIRIVYGLPATSAANSGFLTYGIAPGAYGVVELDGASASVFVKQVGSAGSADPVNQKGSIGVKVYFCPVVLEAARMVRIGSGGRTL